MATSSIVTSLSSILAGLNPRQLLNLGNHLSSAGEMQALSVLDAMTIADVGTLSSQLSTIPNLPPAVMTYVNSAIAAATKSPPDQATFDSALTNAKVQLQQAVVSTNILGGIL